MGKINYHKKLSMCKNVIKYFKRGFVDVKKTVSN